MNPETIEINGEIAYKYIYNGNYYITKSGNHIVHILLVDKVKLI